MKKLVIIDGKSVFYRGYYAMANLSLKDGTPTGGVYGFMAMFLTAVSQLKPTNVIVAWDKKGTSTDKRKKLYTDYKANRKPAPDDFYVQIPILHDLLKVLNVPLVELDGYEADDLMGTLAVQAEEQQIETVLITGDLDLLQLISPFVKVYATKTGFSKIDQFDKELFEQKYGVKLEQFIDYKALRGDTSDNIPGVAGVGPKTAVNLLNDFETLEGIYQNLDKIKPNLAKKLGDNKEMAFLSQKLVRIFTDAPIELDMKSSLITDMDGERALAELEKLEFNSLRNRLAKIIDYKPEDSQGNLFGEVTEEKIEVKNIDNKQLAKLVEEHKIIAEFIEEKLTISVESKKGIYQIEADSETVKILDLASQIITSDIKRLLKKLEQASGENWQKISNLPYSYSKIYNINQISFLIDSLRYKKRFETVKLADFKQIWQIYQNQQKILAENPKIQKVAEELDIPMSLVLLLIEKRGVGIDKNFFESFSKQIDQEIEKLTANIYALSGQEFNINSPKQMSEILFDKLQLPTDGLKKNSNGFSTNRQTLDLLEDKHPIISEIKKLRELTKLKTTYVDNLPDMAGEDGRLHSTFHQDVTLTGRLSSSEPNLQNIPIKSDWGHKLRQGFVAQNGKTLISIDYAQFELRIVAALAEDEKMLEVFNQNRDIHTEMAAQIFEIPAEEVTKNQRRIAKTVNFGVLYGISARSLAMGIDGLEYKEAKEIIDKYFATRQKVSQFMEQTLENAKNIGYVETYFGRRRPTPDVKSPNFHIREAAKRASTNMPIQGTGADLMKKAMIEIETALSDIDGAKQILQIHDSILIESYPKNVEEIKQKLTEIMLNICPNLKVKLAVDIKIGDNWLGL